MTMAKPQRASMILFCLLILGVALAAGCGSDEAQTSPQLDTVAPSTPMDLRAVPSKLGGIQLGWSANTVDPDLAGYIVYRSSSPERGYQALDQNPITTNAFLDGNAAAGRTYWYAVAARDVNHNESPRSAHARITAEASGSKRIRD